jgi:hypothetical protein
MVAVRELVARAYAGLKVSSEVAAFQLNAK